MIEERISVFIFLFYLSTTLEKEELKKYVIYPDIVVRDSKIGDIKR